jgi:hypothetical protein
MIALRVFVLIASVPLMLVVSADAGFVAEENAKSSIAVRADELGGRVIVIGRLESPLRTVMTISGVWQKYRMTAKPGDVVSFFVDEVNGKRLASPVEFRVLDVAVWEPNGAPVQPAIGQRWVLRAYETWPDRDHPDDFVAEFGLPPFAPAARGSTRLLAVIKR